MAAGRYAPSPTGDLHLGNLRTALIAWAAARSTGRAFFLRLEDLDQQRARDPQSQIDDLAELGIDWDGPPIVQSHRLSLYRAAMEELEKKGLVFPCFCSRRDIREATTAAHTHPGRYPGTCLHLPEEERQLRRSTLAERGLRPALRLVPSVNSWTVSDVYKGTYSGSVDNVVLQRGDGAFAYNLAVVVDDIAMGVDQIVRGDDLLESSPVHSYLFSELGGQEPTFGHVPLVLGPGGARLAKRDGAVTLSELKNQGVSTEDVMQLLSDSLGAQGVRTAGQFLDVFPTLRIPDQPWMYQPRSAK